MRRPPVLLDHHTPSSGLQQSRRVNPYGRFDLDMNARMALA